MSKVGRHKQRQWALQILYSLDIRNKITEEAAEIASQELIEREALLDDDYYFNKIVQGVINEIEIIDSLIDKHAIDWEVARIAFIERNILRIAIYEIRHEIPIGVAIDEAVRIAKKYGDEGASSFINGILGKI